MMQITIDISIEIMDYDDLINEKKIKEYLESILNTEYKATKPVYLAILFTTNDVIRIINKDYRNKDEPTDVISFAYHETNDFDIGPYDTLGDIVISLEKISEHAKEYNHSEERELYYVITHGILHLIGYDHMTEEDKKEMRKKEEYLLDKFGYTRDK
jgi:probable rRNA maturation factor